MRSSYLRRMDITISVLLQRPVILTKHKTCENYALVAAGAFFQVRDVVVGVGGVANYQQPIGGSHSLESLDHKMSIVFRLQPRDIQNIPIWLRPPTANRRAIRAAFNFGSIR